MRKRGRRDEDEGQRLEEVEIDGMDEEEEDEGTRTKGTLKKRKDGGEKQKRNKKRKTGEEAALEEVEEGGRTEGEDEKGVRQRKNRRYVGTTARDASKRFFLSLITNHIPEALKRVQKQDRAALKSVLQRAVFRVRDRIERQLIPPMSKKPPDYVQLDQLLARCESSLATNTATLLKISSEVEHKKSEKEQEEKQLEQLQQKMKDLERKQKLLEKKGKLNPSVNVFGKQAYAHPLLAPSSDLVALSVPLTSEPIDPELLIEVIEDEKGKEDADALPTEIDVVQGVVDDLSKVVENRAHLLPVLEDITMARDQLCSMLSQVGDGLDPLYFTSSTSSSLPSP